MSAEALPTVGPYAVAAQTYWQRGWRGLLPVPPSSKAPVPRGWTGRHDAFPSWPDVQAWADGPQGAGNLALRLPPGVVGLDVDAYAGKCGGETLAAAEAQWGPLPATWRSTSRDDGVSGIRLFTVPAGLAWRGELSGGSVEVIQHRHRYVVAPPSIHPSGRVYRWIAPDGRDAGHWPPSPGDLPDLPAAWVEGLTGGELAEDVARVDLGTPGVSAWLEARGAGQPCRQVAGALESIVRELTAPAADRGSRHEAALRGTQRLAHLAAEGHPGVRSALGDARQAFASAFAGESDRDPDPGEWDRMVVGAVDRSAARLDTSEVDPCSSPLAGLVALPSGALELSALPRQPAPADGAVVTTDHLVSSGQPSAIGTLTAEAVAAIDERFPVVDWYELWHSTPAETDWLCEPFLERGGAHVLYSPAKAGKSLLSLEIVAALATGRPVLGNPAREPVTVLYVDQENSRGDLRSRLAALGYGPDDLADLAARLHYLWLPSMDDLDTAAGGQQITALVERYVAELVVVDTLSRVISGEENDADTFRALYKHALQPLKAAGVAVLRLDHSGKEHGKGMRGSSAKAADVDHVWSLVATEGRVRLDRTHSRSGRGSDRLDLRRTRDPLRHVPEGAGLVPTWMEQAQAVLDKAGLPDDVTKGPAGEALAAAGLPLGNDRRAELLRVRKARAGGADRSGTASGAEDVEGCQTSGPDGSSARDVGPGQSGPGPAADRSGPLPPDVGAVPVLRSPPLGGDRGYSPVPPGTAEDSSNYLEQS